MSTGFAKASFPKIPASTDKGKGPQMSKDIGKGPQISKGKGKVAQSKDKFANQRKGAPAKRKAIPIKVKLLSPSKKAKDLEREERFRGRGRGQEAEKAPAPLERHPPPSCPPHITSPVPEPASPIQVSSPIPSTSSSQPPAPTLLSPNQVVTVAEVHTTVINKVVYPLTQKLFPLQYLPPHPFL